MASTLIKCDYKLSNPSELLTSFTSTLTDVIKLSTALVSLSKYICVGGVSQELCFTHLNKPKVLTT